ncbi:MAG TPA: magnesium-translocating P-type ATPase [Thermoanaerobaculaceae bacterium]|nr:magnesium-translocating P-type ATPase [Thermoanaerobaculaceae bacterium]HPS78197.1 magnesium-translocating P-type ATPase [Thermoanaerobaculaceae bacterium]
MNQRTSPFWSLPAADVLAELEAVPQGLSSAAAAARLKRNLPRRLAPGAPSNALTLLVKQFSSPIVLLLLGATVISVFLHDTTDAAIILVIVLASGLLGFWQERGAAGAVEKLLSLVETKVQVRRDGVTRDIPLADVVPGDVVLLSAGATAPGDCLLLEARDLFADEAALTGETFPVEKSVAVLGTDTPLGKRTNTVFMGTHTVSGTATALVVAIGKDTEFGQISDRLKLRPPETDFEHGLRRFGYLLLEVTLLLVIGIFAVNVYLHRPVLDSFLFSMALAVGLTPQLLPAVVSINLAHGARRMAEKKVIVKRLASIENFGSMNVLCTDKTGTITEGVVTLQSTTDLAGASSDRVLLYATLNASFETGFASPIDAAIRSHGGLDITAWKKLDEVPYDFLRKRLSILVAGSEGSLMITKGALEQVLEACTTAEDAAGASVPIDQVREQIQTRFSEYSAKGQRTLGLACKRLGSETRIGRESEVEMSFLGFILLSDPPKPGIEATIGRLRELGVGLKVITGDNALVAATVAREIGLDGARVLSGHELKLMSDGALLHRVTQVDVFAEVEPNQKERIILALRKAGNVVGYMGDGINDASALHAADVGLSVEGAVDVAKEVADIVLLEKDLDVLVEGVREGRLTFANTLKYVLMATSANFGNMFSMAGASLLLPFLPLLPKQILLTNMLTDMPETTIASDNVDDEMLVRPRRWDIGFIRSFMLTFGVLSSVFDYLTFGGLVYLLHATAEGFRTGWFVESVLSASLVVLVVRSRRPFFRSRPGKRLLLASLGVVVVTVALPFLPFAHLLGLAPLPPSYLALIALVVALYIAAGELAKRIFYRHFEADPGSRL